MNDHGAIRYILWLLICLTALLATTSLWANNTSFAQLLNIRALAYVLIGTFLTAIIFHPLHHVILLLRSLPMLIKTPYISTYSEFNQILRIAKLHRHYRIREAEKEASYVNNNFLRYGIQQVLDGKPAGEIKNMLHWHKEGLKTQHMEYIQTTYSMGRLAPSIGVLGGAFYLIYSLINMNDVTLESISLILAYSMIYILYGFIVSVFVLKPLATKQLKYQNNQSTHLLMFEQAIFMIQQRSHPLIIKDTLDGFCYQDYQTTVSASPQKELQTNP